MGEPQEDISANRLGNSTVNSGVSTVKIHQRLSKAYPAALPAVRVRLVSGQDTEISGIKDLPLAAASNGMEGTMHQCRAIKRSHAAASFCH